MITHSLRTTFCGFCGLALLVGAASTSPAQGLFRLHDDFDVALRAQSPDGPAIVPPIGSPDCATPTGDCATPYNPFSPPPASLSAEPYLSSPGGYQPGPPPMPPPYAPTGPQPFVMGPWTKFDVAYLPSAHTSPDVGNFSAIEVDTQFAITEALGVGDLIYTVGGQFDYRNWRATDSFNYDLFRLGLDLQVSTPAGGPFGYQVNFNPSLNSDWRSSFSAESANYDVNGMMFYQMDPVWMWVIGAGYLDRVDDIVIPYAGVVVTPDPLWEFRLLFPQGRVSRYLGEFWWGLHWVYLAWEYHVESFQVDVPNNSQAQIQMEDYRLTFGMRSDHPGFTKYVEAGWVFGRNIEYRRTLPSFDINDGFIVRGGIRF